MSLYNLKSLDGTDYCITKFDAELNVEGDYLMKVEGTVITCSCPAGPRPTCRHRDMLRQFKLTNRVNTEWFYEWEIH